MATLTGMNVTRKGLIRLWEESDLTYADQTKLEFDIGGGYPAIYTLYGEFSGASYPPDDGYIRKITYSAYLEEFEISDFWLPMTRLLSALDLWEASRFIFRGDDYISGISSHLLGFDGDDFMRSDGGYSTLDGGAGNDTLLAGRQHNTTLFGRSGNDELRGGTSSDTLSGNVGDDTLIGRYGNDYLSGGPGEDRFVFDARLDSSGNVDSVGFSPDEDLIILDQTIFTSLATGDLPARTFYSSHGVQAGHDHTDRIIFDTNFGHLYYDVDGAGGTDAVLFATLAAASALSAQDFFVVS